MSTPEITEGVPPSLSHDELVVAQRKTLDTPRRRYSVAARALFVSLDLIYGKKRSLEKFKILEVIARVPYQAWEHVAYIAATHVHEELGLAKRIHQHVLEARAQQDNELWHLVILEELLSRSGKPQPRLKFFWLPQIIAFAYYQQSWLLYVIRPKWSYRLNADFEDHAEHEYMLFVDEHPEWEKEPFGSDFADEYGTFESLADVFRQIGHDERVHKEESLAQMKEDRFQ
jgi:ubiquinol oxidase